jgi:hypothetical protein
MCPIPSDLLFVRSCSDNLLVSGSLSTGAANSRGEAVRAVEDMGFTWANLRQAILTGACAGFWGDSTARQDLCLRLETEIDALYTSYGILNGLEEDSSNVEGSATTSACR